MHWFLEGNKLTNHIRLHKAPRLFQRITKRSIMETGSLKSLQDNLFVDSLAQNDSTWKFWKGFTFTIFLAYLSLFTALHTRNWNLRVVSLKQLAPLFCAFDRPTYSKLVPDHIMDLPSHINIHFEAGVFAVAVGDRKSVFHFTCHRYAIYSGGIQVFVIGQICTPSRPESGTYS